MFSVSACHVSMCVRLCAADDTGGRRRRRVAGHRARAVERLQPRRLRHALLPLHRRHGHSPLPQGPFFLSHAITVHALSPSGDVPFHALLRRHDAISQV